MKDILYTKVRDGEWFAMNYKTCSQSVAKALAVHRDGRVVHFPPNKDNSAFHWGQFLERIEETEEGAQVHLIVRDPVERFRSSMVEAGDKDADAVLDRLEAGTEENRHYLAQSLFVKEGRTTLYKFPDGLEEFEEWLGYPLDHTHESKGRPELTQEQESRVREIYKEDEELFNSL